MIRAKKLKRSYLECIVQGKKGLFVDECTKKSAEDIQYLNKIGYHAYGVQHNNVGTPVVLYDRPAIADVAGYIVFVDEIEFPTREIANQNEEGNRWYGLNNQHSKFTGDRWKEDDIIQILKSMND